MFQELNKTEVMCLLDVLASNNKQFQTEFKKLQNKCRDKKYRTPEMMETVVKCAYTLSGVSKLMLTFFIGLNEDGSCDEAIAEVRENLKTYQAIIDSFHQTIGNETKTKANLN